jgi:hypothetical protein
MGGGRYHAPPTDGRFFPWENPDSDRVAETILVLKTIKILCFGEMAELVDKIAGSDFEHREAVAPKGRRAGCPE